MKTPLRVLLAEDNEGHVRLIQKNLGRAEFDARISVASDGAQALAALSSPNGERPHVVLLDLNLPVVDGFEILRRMKADERLARIPVIVLTTTDDEREIARCQELGCAFYVTKPVDYDRFCETIRRLGQFLAVVAPPPQGVKP